RCAVVDVARIDASARERHVTRPGIGRMASPLDEQHLRLRRGIVDHHGDGGAPPAAEDLRPVRGERATEIVERDHLGRHPRGVYGRAAPPESQTMIAFWTCSRFSA